MQLKENCPNVLKRFRALHCSSTNPNDITTTTLQTPVLWQIDLTRSMSSLKPEESPSLDFAAPVPVYDEDDIITADLSSLLVDPFP